MNMCVYIYIHTYIYIYHITHIYIYVCIYTIHVRAYIGRLNPLRPPPPSSKLSVKLFARPGRSKSSILGFQGLGFKVSRFKTVLRVMVWGAVTGFLWELVFVMLLLSWFVLV